MRRGAAALVLLAAAAGCGGAGPTAPERPRGAVAAAAGELRSPDARSPFVPARGVWRCETAGEVQLAIGAGGEATLSIGGRTLASVSGSRSRVNRACEPRRPRALPAIAVPPAVGGAIALSCRAPRYVLVDFARGDLTVRTAPGGRFLLGAAVSEVHLEVAGYRGAGCAPV